MNFRPLALSYIVGVGVIALLSAAFVYPQISGRMEQAAEANVVVEALLPAVKFVEAMALERGVYNQVLVSKATGAEEGRRLVAGRNAATDAVFEEALERTRRLPPSLQAQLARPIEEAWAGLRAARAEVEPLLSADQPASPEAARKLVAQFAVAGASADRALSAAELSLSRLDPSLGLMLEVSRLNNDMREQAGLRSTLLSRFAGSGKAMSLAERIQASEANGALHAYWRRLQSIAIEVGDDKIAAAVARVKADFFDEAEPIYAAMTDAAREGSTPPLDLLQWRAWTVPKLTQLLAARDPPTEAEAVRVRLLRDQAIRSMLTDLAAFGAVFAVLLIIGLLVEFRVLRPISRLTRALDAIAGAGAPSLGLAGDADALAVQFGARSDEIGSLARAVQRIRNDAQRISDSAAHLEQLNQRFDALLANLPQGVSLFDENGRLAVANPRYAELYGLAADAPLIGLGLSEIAALRAQAVGAPVTGADDLLGEKLEGAAEREIVGSVCELPSGRVLSLNGVRMPGGGWLATHLDITERRRIEDSLRKSEARLSIALSASSTGLWDYFPGDGHAVYSDTWFAMLGYAPGGLPSVRETFVALVHPDDIEAYRDAVAAHVQGRREAIVFELRMRRKNGEWAWIKTVGKAIERDAAGEPSRYIGVHIDVSESRRVQDELAAARDVADRANKAKSEFLANMSHEIRTPMNGIIGMNGLLLDTELTAEQRKYALMTRDSAEALLTIINDVLDISKLEAGRVDLETLDFDLNDLVEAATAVLAPRAAEKKVGLSSYVDPALPESLRGDPLRVRQVLVNLVGNAVKFTERGSVGVQVTRAPSPAQEGWVRLRFEVTDTGPGIPEQAQARLFQKFTQADSSITRRYGGTGLGLAICSKLVALMGGQIGVTSSLGVGSTFWFEIAVEPGLAPLAERAQVAPERLRGLRTLVVDDLPVNIEVLKLQLQALGMDIQTAHDGFEAMAEMERAWFHGRPYDLVLLDQMMPGLAGISLAQRVRAAPNFAETRIVLISSAGNVELKRSVGGVIDAALEKPIRRADLLECLSRLFGSETAADPAVPCCARDHNFEAAGAACKAADPVPERPRGLKVLLAEDNKVNQEVALVMLRKAGHSVRVVDNGMEAVEAASAELFDVVLMDVQMPLLDGIEATKQIRELPGPRGRVRVVALTADAMTGAKEYYLKAGMDDYLAKPIRAAALRAKLAEFAPAEAAHESAA